MTTTTTVVSAMAASTALPVPLTSEFLAEVVEILLASADHHAAR